ncbi:MAG TPA: hypothetical protein VEY08_15465 [Chloroflexia bacterium]|nr:hypothetical protein [Chloroflexia bacterium]
MIRHSNLLRRLLNPGVFAGVLATLALVVLAYQVRPTYAIGVGTPPDTSIVRGFNTPEQMQGEVPQAFRWTTEESFITLRDVGRQDFSVILTVSGFRPEGQEPARLKVDVGGRTVLDVEPAPQLTNYSFEVSRDDVSDGTLVMKLSSNTFVPPGDPNPRPLGVVVTGALVEPGTHPDRFIEPPWRVVVGLVSAAAMMGVLLALLGWGVGAVAWGSALVGLLAGWLLVSNRLWLTSGRWYESWPQALLAGAVFAGLVAGAGWLLQRLTGARWPAHDRRILLSVMLLALVVRFAGQLHPLIHIIDLVFHSHRFDTVQAGQLLFTIRSDEWGGHETFYLPTPYVFMLPLQWLLNDQLLVIRLSTVALGTLGAGLLYLTAVASTGDRRAALLASALYVVVPIAVLPYSWGITSNLFGEFFALGAMTLLVTSYRYIRPTRPAFWALLLLLLPALLSHPGVVQLMGLAVGLTGLLWALFGRRSQPGLEQAVPAGVWVLSALLLGVGLAYMLYYGYFAADMLGTLQQIRAERAAQAQPGAVHLLVGGSVSDRSLGLIVRYAETRREWLVGGLLGFWTEAQAYYRVWPIGAALLGFVSVWPSRRLRGLWAVKRRVLVLTALGWGGAVLAFALVGWTMNLYVRYALFALPLACLGSGVVLSKVWRRGWAGSLLVCLVLAYFAFEALNLWQYRITYAFK